MAAQTGFKNPRWSGGTLFVARRGEEKVLLMRFEGEFKSSIRLVKWRPPGDDEDGRENGGMLSVGAISI